MVKGISKQVIVVHSPDPNLFEQAIFILKEDAVGREGVTEELLLKEAKQMISPQRTKKQVFYSYALIWALTGAFSTGLIWMLTTLF